MGFVGLVLGDWAQGWGHWVSAQVSVRVGVELYKGQSGGTVRKGLALQPTP